MFNLFRLLGKETMKIFSIPERRKGTHEFGGTEVCKAEQVRKKILNPKIQVEIFSYIMFKLVEKISHVLSFYCI